MKAHFNVMTTLSTLFLIYLFMSALRSCFKQTKHIFKTNFFRTALRTLTPRWVIENGKEREQKNVAAEKFEKRKMREEAKVEHYKFKEKYFVNISFVEEDRNELFSGHDIKWKYGKKLIKPEEYNYLDSHALCFWIYQEMAIYRWVFKSSGKWTAAQELFWQKITPPKLKENPIENNFAQTQERNAIQEFESNRKTKASA